MSPILTEPWLCPDRHRRTPGQGLEDLEQRQLGTSGFLLCW
jgi:hypothetical protein